MGLLHTPPSRLVSPITQRIAQLTRRVWGQVWRKRVPEILGLWWGIPRVDPGLGCNSTVAPGVSEPEHDRNIFRRRAVVLKFQDHCMTK